MPLPVPLAPAVIAIQESVLVAVQEQPAPAVTLTIGFTRFEYFILGKTVFLNFMITVSSASPSLLALQFDLSSVFTINLSHNANIHTHVYTTSILATPNDSLVATTVTGISTVPSVQITTTSGAAIPAPTVISGTIILSIV